MTDKPKPEAVSPERAAALLDVHPQTIRREIDRGHLIAFKVGSQTRILRSELIAYTGRQRYPHVSKDAQPLDVNSVTPL